MTCMKHMRINMTDKHSGLTARALMSTIRTTSVPWILFTLVQPVFRTETCPEICDLTL